MGVLDIARLFLHVREAAPNRGQRVEAIQMWCGGHAGDSWCADFATMVLDLYYSGKSLIERTGSCDAILLAAIKHDLIVDQPIPGDLYLRLNGPLDAHHVGFVTAVKPGVIGTLSGNTSEDGQSSNGTGVFEHDIPIPPANKIAFVRLPEKP